MIFEMFFLHELFVYMAGNTGINSAMEKQLLLKKNAYTCPQTGNKSVIEKTRVLCPKLLKHCCLIFGAVTAIYEINQLNLYVGECV